MKVIHLSLPQSELILAKKGCSMVFLRLHVYLFLVICGNLYSNCEVQDVFKKMLCRLMTEVIFKVTYRVSLILSIEFGMMCIMPAQMTGHHQLVSDPYITWLATIGGTVHLWGFGVTITATY